MSKGYGKDFTSYDSGSVRGLLHLVKGLLQNHFLPILHPFVSRCVLMPCRLLHFDQLLCGTIKYWKHQFMKNDFFFKDEKGPKVTYGIILTFCNAFLSTL